LPVNRRRVTVGPDAFRNKGNNKGRIMALDTAFWDGWRPRALAVLRIITAYLLLPHGTAKLFGFPGADGSEGPRLLSLLGAAGVIETVGGVLFLIGLFTRPVAFVLCGFMAFAYFLGHAGDGHVLLPMLNGGELAVLYCFVFLYFVFAGAGAWSVDAAMKRR
jgi:putative oxidoreductase